MAFGPGYGWPVHGRIATAGLVLVALAGLGCDEGGTEDATLARLYAGVVESVVGTEPFVGLEDRSELVVWIYPAIDGAGLDLEVQVEVLDHLADYATVRFVDSFDEAVEEDGDGTPVLDGGVAVGLAPYEDGDERIEAERYESDDVEPSRLELERRGNRWEIVTDETG